MRNDPSRDREQPRKSAVCRRIRRAVAVSAVAVGVALVASWLNGSHFSSTHGLSARVSSPPLSLAALRLPSVPLSTPSASPSCDSLAGLVPFPTSLPSGYAVPSWVDSWALPSCIPLDASSLVTPTGSGGPAPSPSTYVTASDFDATMTQFEALVLFSVGLSIFLLAAIFFRSRK